MKIINSRKFNWLFDSKNKLITCKCKRPRIRHLVTAIRDWEVENLDRSIIARICGGQDLGAGIKVGYTVTLINGWKLNDIKNINKIIGGNIVEQ
jgi:hypothetical protein